MAALTTFAQRWHGHDFYQVEQAEQHFVTAPMMSDGIAAAIAARLAQYWTHPVDVFDVGAGDGSLLRSLAALTNHSLHGVDIRPRPIDLPARIEWHRELPACQTAVVICHEFLDDVPCDIVEIDELGQPRVVVLDDDGVAHPGPRLNDPAAGSDRDSLHGWMQRWWPSTRPLSRVEIGLQRDLTWQRLLRGIDHGQAFAIDYGHLLPERRIGTWDAGTVIGFAHGRSVGAEFTPGRNITAHVAFDSVAHATVGTRHRLSRQRRILQSRGSHGFSTGTLDDYLWLEVHFDRRNDG
jgi:SAM-dependent MidA family methyltransferase